MRVPVSTLISKKAFSNKLAPCVYSKKPLALASNHSFLSYQGWPVLANRVRVLRQPHREDQQQQVWRPEDCRPHARGRNLRNGLRVCRSASAGVEPGLLLLFGIFITRLSSSFDYIAFCFSALTTKRVHQRLPAKEEAKLCVMSTAHQPGFIPTELGRCMGP